MKTAILLIIFLMIVHIAGRCQSCLPDGITFSTQEEIDSFQANYPGCTEVEGSVQIDGSDITNLNGLNVINRIGGSLYVRDCSSLVNLIGLNALTNVDGDFVSILRNDLLANLDGLNNLSTTGGNFFLFENNSMTNLVGLSSLSHVDEDFVIQNMQSLTSVTGIESLNSVGGSFQILYNNSLVNLSGASSLSTIQETLNILGNDALTSLTGLDNISSSSISYLYIGGNLSLSNCSAQSICNYLAAPNGAIFISNNSTGCNNQQEVEESCESLHILENQTDYQFIIYPNPANDIIFIGGNIDEQVSDIRISDLSGRLILKQKPSNKITISNLISGLYYIELTLSNCTIRQKLIKK